MISHSEYLVQAAQDYNRIPLGQELFADLDTPLSLYLKLGRGIAPKSFKITHSLKLMKSILYPSLKLFMLVFTLLKSPIYHILRVDWLAILAMKPFITLNHLCIT